MWPARRAIELITWPTSTARLQMVLLENIHIGNCQSETKFVFQLSPLRSPILMAGAVISFGVHLLAGHTLLGQLLLGAVHRRRTNQRD